MRAAVLSQPRSAGDGTLRIVERGSLTPATGELLLTVTACAGSGTPQTFTCTPLSRAIAAGTAVRLYQPAALGL